LHRVKAFSTPHICPPVSRLGVHENLGGGTADPREIPDHVTSCSAIKVGGRGKFARATVAWGLSGHQSAGSEQLGFFASPVFLGFVVLCFLFIYLFNCLYLNIQVL